MHTIKITPNLLFEYQCTSGKFIRLPNRIETFFAGIGMLYQTDNHAGTPPLSFLQAGCPSCRPTNSVKALKAYNIFLHLKLISQIVFVMTPVGK